jgi:hypothetical protein
VMDVLSVPCAAMNCRGLDAIMKEAKLLRRLYRSRQHVLRAMWEEEEEENEKEKEEEEEEEDEEEEATETLEAEKMTKTRGEINENYFENQDRILATRWLEQCKSASLKHTLASWLEESIRSKAVDKGTLGIPKRSNCIAMPESNKKLKASGRTASNPIELA